MGGGNGSCGGNCGGGDGSDGGNDRWFLVKSESTVVRGEGGTFMTLH